MTLLNKQRGVTLIEVLISGFIISVGLLGIAGLQTASIKESLDTAQSSQATWLVNELVERMRANPDGQATGYNRTIQTGNCPTTPVKQCADTASSNADTDCTADQMAAYDVWEVFCGQTIANSTANSTDSLNLDQISISCDGGATCTDTDEFTVSISWTSRAAADGKLGASAASQAQNITMTVRP